MPRDIIVKLLKQKTEKKILKAGREQMTPYLYGKILMIEASASKHDGQENVAQHFAGTERKEL